ncbi:signal peptidase I [Naumannella huperziae]
MERARRLAASLVLWTGCAAGVVCLTWTLGVLLSGVTPLVFLSGSMSPAIRTGDLAFAETVPASELSVGDVVSVQTAEGVRVTHRVIETAPSGPAGEIALRLRGDANAAPDAEAYRVTEAERVIVSVPAAGYLLNAARQPLALLLGGALAAGAIAIGFSRRGPDGRGDREDDDHGDGDDHGDDAPGGARRRADDGLPRRAAALTAALIAAPAGALAGTAPLPTLAAFSDAAAARTGTYSALRIAQPADLRCAVSGIILTSVSVRWQHTDARYDYLVRVTDGNGQAVQTTRVTGSGSVGSTLAVDVPSSRSGTYAVGVSSVLKTPAAWESPAATTGYSVAWLGKSCRN